MDAIYSPGYFDEQDFSYRASKAGFRSVRSKSACIWHYGSISFKKKIGNKGIKDIFERNRKIFYQRWGRPLKIVFAVDSLGYGRWRNLKQLIFELVKTGNHVYILDKYKMPLPEHTNISKIFLFKWLFYFCVLFFILDNLRHNPVKHYHLIFVSSQRLRRFLIYFTPLRKYKILPFDFSNHKIKELVNKLVDAQRFSAA